MSPADFEAMRDAQSGVCLICKRTPDMFVVDHDHRTGAVRGLLCGPCNRALGHFSDRPELCLAAAEYLRGSTYA